MPLAADSYGSAAGVAAYVRHMANASGAFDATTAPTLTQVETFLDQQSARLNAWLAAAGYGIPVTATAAVRVLTMYANIGAAGLAELSQRSAGYNAEDENRRENKFLEMFDEAEAFIASGALSGLGAALTTTGLPPALSGLRVGGGTRGGLALVPIFTRTSFGNNPTAETGAEESDARRP